MIQRVQSLFLLVAAVCFGLACFVPIGTLDIVGMDCTYYIYTPWMLKNGGGNVVQETLYLGLLLVILAVISFAAIFFYKNRPLQSKICTAAIVINFVLLALALLFYPDYAFSQVRQIENLDEVQYTLWALLYIIPLALLYLANKFILKDEKKVRAADRLR
jgi:hypothetical protein